MSSLIHAVWSKQVSLDGHRQDWRDWRAEVEEYLDAGKSVVVLGYYAGTHAVTDRSMKAVFAHVYDVDDGRITRFR